MMRFLVSSTLVGAYQWKINSFLLNSIKKTGASTVWCISSHLINLVTEQMSKYMYKSSSRSEDEVLPKDKILMTSQGCHNSAFFVKDSIVPTQ